MVASPTSGSAISTDLLGLSRRGRVAGRSPAGSSDLDPPIPLRRVRLGRGVNDVANAEETLRGLIGRRGRLSLRPLLDQVTAGLVGIRDCCNIGRPELDRIYDDFRSRPNDAQPPLAAPHQ